ncbi:hypothetical protein [Pontiella agarivorans]|uniref:DUF2059 domain-containing protein n=1 Tax=Pontiella agarivorans TaxID=3038953 RepID=A0ABU5N1M5_9BACT|nr:hypothetical protein [Pontiella agarivorans]MDZ8120318.1 hypothetical protein [Pontiella agarivorans]
MKTIITFIIAISVTITGFSESKDELIEKLIILNGVELQFNEGAEKILNQLMQSYEGKGKSYDSIKEIVRKHCNWKSWKPYYTSLLDETYTKKELESLIQYRTSIPPEIMKLSEKQVDIQVRYTFAQRKWVEEIQPLISDDIQKLPPTPAEELESYADKWNSWSEGEKRFYISGYKTGCEGAIAEFSRELKPKKEVLNKITKRVELNSHFQKLSGAVTDFYADPKNAEIPYIPAFYLVDAKLQGNDISEKLERARKRSSKTDPNRLSKDVRQP